MKGMESLIDTLVNAVCKAVNISPEVIKAHFEALQLAVPTYAKRGMELLTSTDARLANLERQNIMILELLHVHNGSTLPAGSGHATAVDLAAASTSHESNYLNGAAVPTDQFTVKQEG